MQAGMLAPDEAGVARLIPIVRAGADSQPNKAPASSNVRGTPLHQVLVICPVATFSQVEEISRVKSDIGWAEFEMEDTGVPSEGKPPCECRRTDRFG